MLPQKFPDIWVALEGNTEVPGEDLSPFSPPDRDRRVDSPALSARGSRPSPRTSDEAVSRGNSRRSLDGGATCRKTAISRSALDKNAMPRHLFEDSVDEGTTRRGTDTPVHRPEKTAGYSYSSTSSCHPVNNSRGKRRSIPAHKTRPDSPLPTMQGAAIRIRNGEEP